MSENFISRGPDGGQLAGGNRTLFHRALECLMILELRWY